VKVTPETVLRKNPNAAYRIFDGQATVVLPNRSEVNVLNEIGSTVWERIDGARTVGQIIEAVLAEYEVGAETARQDILAFIDDLHEHEMVS
jgi:hypothetical protein